MKLQDAITVAIDFEKKVRDHYVKGAKEIPEPQGRKVFTLLGKEEQGHVEYLEHCLAQWKKTGQVPKLPLKSILPKGSKWIEAERKKLDGKGKRAATNTELDALKLALQHEKDADEFYHKLVGSLGNEDQALFAKFLEIEDGHLAIVQAQLDSVQGMGFWFDVAEFRLEAE